MKLFEYYYLAYVGEFDAIDDYAEENGLILAADEAVAIEKFNDMLSAFSEVIDESLEETSMFEAAQVYTEDYKPIGSELTLLELEKVRNQRGGDYDDLI
jgi:hypothetical protein